MQRIKALLVFLLLALNLTVVAQVSNTYVRKKLELSPDELSIPLLLDSAQKTLAIDGNTTFKLLEQAYFLSLQQAGKNQQHLVLKALGDYYSYYDQHDLAALNYKNSLNAMPRTRNKSELLLLAVAQYLKAEEYRTAIGLLTSNRGVFSPEQQATSFQYLGDIYKELSQPDSALFYYSKAQPLLKNAGEGRNLLSLNLKMAEVHGMQGNNNLQQAFIKSVTEVDTAPSDLIMKAYAQLADYHKASNNRDLEISIRQKLIIMLEKAAKTNRFEDKTIESKLIKEKIALAGIYNDLKRYRQALDLLKTLQASGNNNREVLELQKEVVKARSEAYLNMGQKENALENYEQYTTILAQLYEESEIEYQNIKELNRQLQQQQGRLDFLEKDKSIYDAEVQAITQEKKVQQQKIQYQRWSIFSLVIALLLLAIVLILLTARARIQRQHNDYLALKSLRSQINPHFIFNSLNSLNHYFVKNDEVSANKYLSGFSRLMRNVLNQAEQDFIPLEKELDILENYLKMEKLRFPKTFEYAIEVHKEVRPRNFFIPPMLVQPHIENAIWHGLRYKKDLGNLWVDFSMDDDLLKVTICDNGIGRERSEILKTENQNRKKSHGMEITQKRLALLSKIYKKRVRQQVSDLYNNGEGTRVEIWIPRLAHQNN